MSPALLAVRRPVFVAAIVILLLALGMISLKKMPLDLLPDVTFPTIVVQTAYDGAGPQEVEMEISKILEDEVSTISGVQKVSSENREGVSILSVEFSLKTNLDFAEQQVRAKVSNAKSLLPDDVEEPVIKRISPSDQPILGVALESDLPPGELYDLADEVISPQFESVSQVGQVEILGGRQREVHVVLDKNKLRAAEVSATSVVAALKSGGRNIPAGKVDSPTKEYTYRTMAEYKSLEDIKGTALRLASTAFSVTIGTVGDVINSLQDEVSRGRFNGNNAIVFSIFRQTGANSVRVRDDVVKKITKVNAELAAKGIKAKMTVVNDQTKRIRANIDDVLESIIFGILLTVIVVYFFLGSFKSTLITGFALPNSLIGAFIFMSYWGFSINIMSMLALSLVVGLLVDDAIVVRENIFRKLEEGMSPKKAAVFGTDQVTLAVVATTLTVLAVFGPIGNLEGIVGQFFKQFGLTVCFAMVVSLFDGLLVAPALSAYLGGGGTDHNAVPRTAFGRANKRMLKAFDRFQTRLEQIYVWVLKYALHHPGKTILTAVGVFIFSIFIAKFVPFTFLPPQDNGEFFVQFELPVGSSLDATDVIAKDVETRLRSMPQVMNVLTTLGGISGQGSNKASIFVGLVDSHHRKENTTQTKNLVKEKLKDLLPYRLIVTDQEAKSGQASRPFNLNVVGQDLETLIPYSEKVLAYAKKHPALAQADTSYRTGKPEFQVKLKPQVAQIAGVTVTGIGQELRALIEGQTPAIYREKGIDYDVRVRLQEDQRDLRNQFGSLLTPNLRGQVLALANVATLNETTGPSTILRENRTRYVQISADLVPGGPGMGGAISDFNAAAISGELKAPPGVSFSFVGEAERFKELMTNMLLSLGLGVMFIYLVLASLYGSFITPITIMSVIPLAASGAFFALFICRSSFDLFSMIGCVTLMGLATKNSILLLDTASEHVRDHGASRYDSLLKAGEARLRPILMTSLALIAGMVPVAIGLNEASKQRTSLGIVVIGGTISSTLLTLVVIPAAHMYIDRFQDWVLKIYHRIFGEDHSVL
ncbi:MAG: efflux RND transporter permease subunit [Proteobacteria bacterium]|nr:MAG: efflux RND transporter permease subunit [Pseudomonadota bacterium]